MPTRIEYFTDAVETPLPAPSNNFGVTALPNQGKIVSSTHSMCWAFVGWSQNRLCVGPQSVSVTLQTEVQGALRLSVQLNEHFDEAFCAAIFWRTHNTNWRLAGFAPVHDLDQIEFILANSSNLPAVNDIDAPSNLLGNRQPQGMNFDNFEVESQPIFLEYEQQVPVQINQGPNFVQQVGTGLHYYNFADNIGALSNQNNNFVRMSTAHWKAVAVGPRSGQRLNCVESDPIKRRHYEIRVVHEE